MWDVDGNEFIDYVGSWGPMILGHADEEVRNALSNALTLGTSYGAPREQFANRDREAELRQRATELDAREIRRRLTVLEEVLRSIDGNVSADMTLFSAMARVAGSRVGEGEWPAHPPGRWDY